MPNQITKVGTLADSDIIELCNKHELISENFERNNVKQACYELRASNIYYDLSQGCEKNILNAGEYILIKPKQLIVIITQETIKMPDDMLGRILTKGKLFSIGLLPVNTYADPGFYGKLGIVFNNISNNYLKLNPDDAIAKIEFTRLQKTIETPYHGQHGYQTQIWPIPTDLILTEEEIKSDKRIGNPTDEIKSSFGNDINKVIQRVFVFERKLILASIVYFIFTIALICFIPNNTWQNYFVPVVLGVLSNITFGILIYLATNLQKGRR